MLHKTRLKIIFWASLVAGVGLCIGGIWLSPLLVPGGILIAGALSMYQSAYVASELIHLEHTEQHIEMVPISSNPKHGHEVTQNIGLFLMYRPRTDSELTDTPPERPSAPSPAPIIMLA